MRRPAHEGRRWLRQAAHDLEAARYNRQGGFHAVACFYAQQAAEKALKAFLFARGERVVIGHSVAELCQSCSEYEKRFGELTVRIGKLDRFYIPTRYPNGLPGGVPAEVYGEEDASEAIALASEIVGVVRGLLKDG
jgi:HEPN domain-containing protein